MSSDFEFSATSKKKLRTLHPDLKLVMICALELSAVDFGIAEGHRSVELQYQYFKEGKSRIDGINKKGKHNFKPSLAVDVFAVVDGKANYDEANMREIARAVDFCAGQLRLSGKISHDVVWGGNWKTFVDMPHFELA